MTRVLASLAFAIALAAAGSFAYMAVDSPKPAVAASKFKTCKSKTPSGAMKTWHCGADQGCCVNHTMNLYVCGFAGLGCL